jgi:hypothetical protein
MKLLDRLCAGALFLVAFVDCLLVPKSYTGRIWIFGTGLALLFTAMLNVLRLRNGYTIQSLKMFCIGANLLMLNFVAVLMISIGKARALHNPGIILVAILVTVEMMFSFAKNP